MSTRGRLREAGEEDAIVERYLDFYVAMCERSIEGGLRRLVYWLDWLESEIDNIRLALQRCSATKDFARGTAISGGAGWYWMTRATAEGVRWLDEFLPAEAGEAGARAQAYFTRGFLATLQSDIAAADPALERAVDLARETGRTRLAVQALCTASIEMDFKGDTARGQQLLEEATLETSRIDDPAATAALLQARDNRAFATGDAAAAVPFATESVRIARETDNVYALEYGLLHLGFAGIFLGDPAQARDRFAEALRIARQIDDRLAEFYILSALAAVAVGLGDAPLSARLLGAADSVRKGAGASLSVMLAQLLAASEEAAIAALGRSKFDLEFNAGSQMSRDAAIVLALGEKEENRPPARRAATGRSGSASRMLRGSSPTA